MDLPSLPEVALRVCRALHDSDQDLYSLAIEIQADAHLHLDAINLMETIHEVRDEIHDIVDMLMS